MIEREMSSLLITCAAAACVLAALLHFACIAWGADGYRLLGAGERVAAAAAGSWRPHAMALLIGTVLLGWAWYALAGAGWVAPPPLLRPVLFLIALVLLSRAVAFPLLRPMFPGNGELFWYVSSALVGTLGLLFLFGALMRGKA
jgi:hypothetical protein